MYFALLMLMAVPTAAGEPVTGEAAAAADPVTPVEAPVDWDREFGVEEKVRDPATGEFPVEPYDVSDRNAGARAFSGQAMAQAFGGQAGIRGIVDRTIDRSVADPRIASAFVSHDLVRLRRTLFEQFCFILNAGCHYTGRTMNSSHAALGLRRSDLNALVENLQAAMHEAKVPFAAQNRFLAKLAPMSRDVVTR